MSDYGEQGSAALGGILAAFLLSALEGEVPGTHMPADGEDLVIGHIEAPAEQLNDGLLAVAAGEGAVVHLVAFVFFPSAAGGLAALDSLLVDFRLADIVKESRDGDTVFGNPIRHIRAHLDLLLSKHHGLVIDIEGML